MDINDKRISDYIAGECDAMAKKEVEEALANDPSLAEAVDEMFLVANVAREAYDVEDDSRVATAPVAKERANWRVVGWFAAAAVVLFVAGVAVQTNTLGTSELARRGSPERAAKEEALIRELELKDQLAQNQSVGSTPIGGDVMMEELYSLEPSSRPELQNSAVGARVSELPAIEGTEMGGGVAGRGGGTIGQQGGAASADPNVGLGNTESNRGFGGITLGSEFHGTTSQDESQEVPAIVVGGQEVPFIAGSGSSIDNLESNTSPEEEKLAQILADRARIEEPVMRKYQFPSAAGPDSTSQEYSDYYEQPTQLGFNADFGTVTELQTLVEARGYGTPQETPTLNWQFNDMQLADGLYKIALDIDGDGTIETFTYTPPTLDHNTEAYDPITDNPFTGVKDEPLSTFSIDVDTGSYSNVRRYLNDGQLPPPNAVRIEELINYFDYDYAPPADREQPFAVHTERTACPWNDQHQLFRIGLKGWEIADEDRPPCNLVFLLDVSGSMDKPNKLPLVKDAMGMLTAKLRPVDRIAIVVYANASGLVLPSTSAENPAAIYEAIGKLEAGGSTNGGAGIQLAYATAKQHFNEEGVNRVILATDGDFNVGTTDRGALVELVEHHAKDGIFLTALGFGVGNLKDGMLEQLADKGNGNYGYIDTANEARKMLVNELNSTIVTIAKDVKIQVEFNPAHVQAYRLIGYENRVMAAQDFHDDTKDAGEIGAGHTVTALYELVPPGAVTNPSADELRYQPAVESTPQHTAELLTVKLRYKKPDGDTSSLIEVPVENEATAKTGTPDMQLATAVAGFGMILRNSPYKGTVSIHDVLELARAGAETDKHGYRNDFVHLVTKTAAMPQFASKAPAIEFTLEMIDGKPQIGVRDGNGEVVPLLEGAQFNGYTVLTIDLSGKTTSILDTRTNIVHRIPIDL